MARHPSIIIHPPENCPEDWEQMTPTGCGRFCASCQKTVIDFTVMSDNEIINIFETKEYFCGRINNDQLNRELAYTPEKKSIFIKLYGKVATVLLIANAFAHNATAQQRKPVKTSISTAQHNKRSQTKRLEGKVVEINGIGVMSDMRVVLSVDSTPVLTQVPDMEGRYHFDLDRRVRNKIVTLQVCFADYSKDTIEQHAVTSKAQIFLTPDLHTVVLDVAVIYEQKMEQVAVVGYQTQGGFTGRGYRLPRRSITRRIWSRITIPFRKIF